MYQRLVRDEKMRGIGIIFFVLIITLMSSRIFGEALIFICDKHNYKTFTKGPPVTLHRKHFQSFP